MPPYKICLAGDPMVGKTSLIRRFVRDEYDDSYLMTLGTRVSKRSMEVVVKGQRRDVDFLIWDIMGQPGVRQFLKQSYFFGARGVLLICDFTRRVNLDHLSWWWDAITEVAGKLPTIVAANKADLLDQAEFGVEHLKSRCAPYGWTYTTTSAKTGEGVKAAFEFLGRLVATSPPPRKRAQPLGEQG